MEMMDISNNRLQGPLHKVSGPLTRDVVLKKMKRILRCIIGTMALCLAGCGTVRHAYWHPTPEEIDPSVFAVVIPQIEFHANTVEESVAILLQHWRAAAQTDNLPVTVVVDYADRDKDGNPDEIYEGYPGLRQRITFSARDITVAKCLDIIETLSPHHLTIRPGFLQFESRHWIEEDWVATLIPVSAMSRSALGLTDQTPPAELRGIFEYYGVTFDDWMKIRWVPDVESIALINLPSEIEKIRGLIHLLDQGFTVEKEKHNKRLQAIGAKARLQPEP